MTLEELRAAGLIICQPVPSFTDDIEYLMRKMFDTLRVPREYMVEDDGRRPPSR